MRKINTHQLNFDGGDKNDFFYKTILPELEKNGHWSGHMDKEYYHRMPGISSTQIRDFMSDPYNVQFFNDHPELREDDKPCFIIGRLFHEAILEGAAYKSDGEVVDTLIASGYQKPRITKDYKRFKKDCENMGIHVVKPAEYVMLEHWKKAAKAEKKLKQIFEHKGTKFEKTYVTVDPTTNLIIKFTADIINEKLKVIFDAKFVSGRESWTGEVSKYGYHVQAAFYLYCANLVFGGYELFPFVHYLKKPPFKISFKEINPDDVEVAIDAISEALESMAKSYKTGKWGSILDPIIETSRPLKEWQNTLIKENYDA